MPLPSPGVPTKCFPAADEAVAMMPPTPPQMPSTNSGGDGAGFHTQSNAKGEAVGVAWLGGSETTASASPAGAAAAVTGEKNNGRPGRARVVQAERTRSGAEH